MNLALCRCFPYQSMSIHIHIRASQAHVRKNDRQHQKSKPCNPNRGATPHSMFRRIPLQFPIRLMSTSSKTVLLTGTERSQILPTLSKWTPNSDETTISRAIKFGSFNEAWGFMSRVALRAEKLNHHPEWKNVRSHKYKLSRWVCRGWLGGCDRADGRFMIGWILR